jgi:hypothetical protein
MDRGRRILRGGGAAPLDHSGSWLGTLGPGARPLGLVAGTSRLRTRRTARGLAMALSRSSAALLLGVGAAAAGAGSAPVAEPHLVRKRYHVFYQRIIDAVPQRWGHVVSSNLVD